MTKSRQAKDFLVQQASEQAALEGVQLSDLEKRMMYFTESDSSCENPAALNEEFEAKYNTDEYETKVSELLHHAYERLKKEDPEKVRNWDQSIQTLWKGDHYILVLWDNNRSIEPAAAHSVSDSLKLLGSGLLLATVFIVLGFLGAKYDISWDRFRKYLPAPNPRLALVLLIGLFVLALIGARLFTEVMKHYWLKSEMGENVIAIGIVAIMFSLAVFTLLDVWTLLTGKFVALTGLYGIWYVLLATVAALFSALTVFVWRPGLPRIVIGLFSIAMVSHIIEQFVILPALQMKVVAVCRIGIALGLILLFVQYSRTAKAAKSW
jgi:hypothetical protein